ncbi:MAG: sel1 repeat family protein [Alphaproteobacteria bacterium]|nr:sel1 repeat family protein [Alphaproteobacteria bacterium]
MSSKLALIILFSLLTSLSVPALADDYGDALAASKRGDFAASFKLLKPLAEKGDAQAQGELGALYLSGRGAPKDPKEGFRWTKEAANKGLATAQYNLGIMYLDGQAAPQNFPEAMKWLLAAAGQGVPAAQAGVAAMFYEGQGVPQNYQEAAKWMQLAAAQGDPEAQLNLGTMYAFGQGLDRDIIRGAMWTYLATESSTFSEAERKTLRDISLKTLNPEETAKIQEMAKKCKESNFKQCP